VGGAPHRPSCVVKEEWKEVREGGMEKVGNRSQEIQCWEFRSHCTMDQKSIYINLKEISKTLSSDVVRCFYKISSLCSA